MSKFRLEKDYMTKKMKEQEEAVELRVNSRFSCKLHKFTFVVLSG